MMQRVWLAGACLLLLGLSFHEAASQQPGPGERRERFRAMSRQAEEKGLAGNDYGKDLLRQHYEQHPHRH